MRVTSHRRWLLLVAGIAVVVPLLGVISIPLSAPTLAAAACPSCYGMQRIAENLFVDAAMPEAKRRDLQRSMSAAESKVAAFFGLLSGRRIILACGDEACESRLRGWLEGSARVRAFTYAVVNVIRLSPRGLSDTILAHELSHVQVHARIGLIDHLAGRFPAWFDEGLAVVISDDRRYMKAGQTSGERCLPTPDGELPVTPISWNAMAGGSEWIYAKAACQVMRWMESNGGQEAVLTALADVTAGKRFRP